MNAESPEKGINHRELVESAIANDTFGESLRPLSDEDLNKLREILLEKDRELSELLKTVDDLGPNIIVAKIRAVLIKITGGRIGDTEGRKARGELRHEILRDILTVLRLNLEEIGGEKDRRLGETIEESQRELDDFKGVLDRQESTLAGLKAELLAMRGPAGSGEEMPSEA